MQLQRATRKQSKIKLSISGPSGSVKTYSALKLAFGICNDWNKIAVLDSENFSASLYAHLGAFNVLNLHEPFTPEQYIEAIQLCEREGIEVIIIDSITHEWSGKGGCLDIHEKETSKMRVPNSFTAWATVTPRHQAFVEAIVRSQSHVICCTRSKTEYVMSERNGRQVPQKMGMAPITREGFDFEVSIHFELDQQHKAFCSKDRTGLFMNREAFVLTPETGKAITDWCESGEAINANDVMVRINGCSSLSELLQVYKDYPQFKQSLLTEFENRKRQLIINQEVQTQLSNQPINSNGVH
jgi:hypothetical protein